MTDFFKRMSETALGVAATVQPLVASRYAPGPRLVVPEFQQVSALDSEPRELTRPDRQQPDAIAEKESELDRHDKTIPQNSRQLQPDERRLRDEPPATRATVSQPQTLRREAADDSVPRPAADADVEAAPATSYIEKTLQTEPRSRIVEFEAGQVISPPERIVQPVNRVQGGPDAQESLPPVHSNGFVVDESVPAAQSFIRPGSGSVLPAIEEESPAPESRQQTSQVLSAVPLATKAEEQNQLPQKIERRKDSPQEHAPVQLPSRPLELEARDGDRRVDSEPTVIRVTIGRIDVRAIMPAAPPVEAPAKPSPPKLSLDEYLRRQSRRQL